MRHEGVRLAETVAQAANLGAGVGLEGLEVGSVAFQRCLLARELGAEELVPVEEGVLDAFEGLGGCDAAVKVEFFVAGVGDGFPLFVTVAVAVAVGATGGGAPGNGGGGGGG